MKKTLLLLLFSVGILVTKAQTTCATALPITPGPHSVSFQSGSQVPTPICSQFGAGASMGAWYSFTSPMDTAVTVST